MEEVQQGPVSGIKDYIINARKMGWPDSDIITALSKGGWPKDIIDQAVAYANTIAQPVQEKINSGNPIIQETKAETNTVNSDLFTTPPVGAQKKEPLPEAKSNSAKPFTMLALLALLLSPIPFIGLGVGMSIFEYAKKNNKSGGTLALLSVLINFIIILFLVYLIYQIFTLDPSQLSGFSKYINDKLSLI